MKVRKAVVVAAGLGTRMLPATRVIPKEILPVVDRPAIQVVVEEAIASGIEEIVVVVAPGRSLVLDHFAPVPDLERHLHERGKRDLLDLVRSIAAMTRITRADQKQPLGLAMPCSRRARRSATSLLQYFCPTIFSILSRHACANCSMWPRRARRRWSH